MNSFKQRLVAIRNEENELKDKLAEVEDEIRSMKMRNDELNGVVVGLQSNEKLLILKLEKETERLKVMEAQISSHQLRHAKIEKGVEDLNAVEMDPESREDAVELELSKTREEIRLIGTQYDEVVIHQQHLQGDVNKKQQKANTLERAVNDLEVQYSALLKACENAESSEPHEDVIDDLEVRLRDLQRQLEVATNTYESSEREITRLDRLISQNKADLHKQQMANEKLKKELDGIFAELDPSAE